VIFVARQGIGNWPGSDEQIALFLPIARGWWLGYVRIKVTIPGQILRVGELLLLFI